MSGSCPVSAHVCQETARERDELAHWKNRAIPLLDRLALWKAEALRERDELRAEVERLRAGLEALHRPEPFHDDPSATFCAHCQRTAGVWPCATAALLNPTVGGCWEDSLHPPLLNPTEGEDDE